MSSVYVLRKNHYIPEGADEKEVNRQLICIEEGVFSYILDKHKERPIKINVEFVRLVTDRHPADEALRGLIGYQVVCKYTEYTKGRIE